MPNVLKMATIEGARAIGAGGPDRLPGTRQRGRRVILIDTRQPHLTPLYHPASHMVYAAGGSDVRHVFVSGQPLVQDRRLLAMDIRKIMDRVNNIAQEIRKPWT
jgi:5-methylthioadenosine/S-adenosylhomocysteine deaminase